MSEKPLLKESLRLLSNNGLNPCKQDLKSKIKSTISSLLSFIFSVQIIIELIFNWNGLDSIDTATGFVSNSQITAKIFTVIMSRQNLAFVLKSMEFSFWDVERFGKKHKDDILNLFKYIKISMGFITVTYLSTGFVYHVRPLLTNPKTLPIPAYYIFNPASSELNYYIAYFYQIILLTTIGIPSLFGFDFLFMSLIVYLVIELRLVKAGIAAIDDKNNLKEINDIIGHHSLILICIKKVKQSYSLLLMNQFLSSMFVVTTGLLTIISNGFPPNMDNIVKPIPYLTSYISVLFFYCYLGSYLINEVQSLIEIDTESVADAAYTSPWWIHADSSYKKKIVLIIQRAQKIEKLSAGGMFDLNLANFTNIAKTGFSLFTLAQALLAKV